MSLTEFKIGTPVPVWTKPTVLDEMHEQGDMPRLFAIVSQGQNNAPNLDKQPC